MTQTQLIEKARAGKRIHTRYSMHIRQKPGACTHPRGFRVIVCDGDHDLVECVESGCQRLKRCRFDVNGDGS